MLNVVRAVALGLVATTSAVAAPPAASQWIGGYEMGGSFTLVKLHLDASSSSGRVEIEGRTVPLTSASRQGDRLRVSFDTPGGPATFDGRRRVASWEGVVRSGDRSATIAFVPTVALDRASRDEARGLYEVAPGHHVAVEWALDGIPELAWVDYRSGVTRLLFAEAPDHFFAGPSILVPSPRELAIAVQRDASSVVTGLRVQETGKPAFVVRRVAVREEPVTFHNGPVVLQGTLLLPPGDGRHPAVVLTQTSSSATREAYRISANFFVSEGLAALVYDKRGTGASTGDLARATFPLLADDALAGLRRLMDHPAIDPDRIGVWGASQGGWISLLAAARSRDVAFAIPTSAPTVTPAEQELYRIGNNLRAAGLSEAEVTTALEYQQQYFDFTLRNRGRDALADRWQQVKGERWAPHVYGMGAGGYWEPTDRDFFFYDPLPALARVRVPVLAIFGGRDTFVPVPKSITLLEEHLKRAGHAALTVQLHPDGTHGLGEVPAGEPDHFWRLRRYVPGFFEGMAHWLRTHVTAGSKETAPPASR